MFNTKLMLTGAMALGMVSYGQAAFAQDRTITITPGRANDSAISYQQAAPTRLFEVEKAITLAPGENRVGMNLQLGGMGIGGAAPGLAGGVNVRADMNVSPGLEAGISATGMGAGGASNLLGNLNLRGKMAMTEFAVGSTPVEVAGLANLGGLVTGGGLTSGSVGIGFPMTAALASNINMTVAPGVGFGFAAGGFLPGGAAPQASAVGFTPALGLGLDVGLTDRLSAMIDGNVGYAGGFASNGNLGLRYGINDDLAADIFVGYNGNPLNALGAGTVGLGGYYAF
jgi:hypothetical protein